MGVNAPGRPTTMTFFPAQYSATLIFSTSGNPCITSTEGIFEGAANARVDEEPKVPAETVCIPMRAAKVRFLNNFMLFVMMEMDRRPRLEDWMASTTVPVPAKEEGRQIPRII